MSRGVPGFPQAVRQGFGVRLGARDPNERVMARRLAFKRSGGHAQIGHQRRLDAAHCRLPTVDRLHGIALEDAVAVRDRQNMAGDAQDIRHLVLVESQQMPHRGGDADRVHRPRRLKTHVPMRGLHGHPRPSGRFVAHRDRRQQVSAA